MKDTLRLHSDKVKMVAHRGLSGLETESTNAAFVAAGNRSYWGIETDVRVTGDGHLICLHDADTASVAQDKLVAAESSYEALRSLRLKDINDQKTRADLRLTCPEEYLSICRKYNKEAVLEIKGLYTERQLDQLLETVRSSGWLERTTFIGGRTEYLLSLRELLPENRMQFVGWKLEDDAMLDTFARHRIGLDLCYRGIDADLVRRAHACGLEVNAWVVNDLETAQRMLDCGVDYLTTNILE